MAIDPRNYDLDELRSVSVSQPSLDDGSDDEWPGKFEPALDPTADEGAEADAASVSILERMTEERSTETERPAAAVAFEESVTRDILALGRQSGPVARPYLPTLPASLAAEVLVFEWLEYLVLQAGRESVADALAMYERVGWLGDDAADALDAYLSGIDDDRANDENPLDADDHRMSLRYVARLAALRGE